MSGVKNERKRLKQFCLNTTPPDKPTPPNPPPHPPRTPPPPPLAKKKKKKQTPPPPPKHPPNPWGTLRIDFNFDEFQTYRKYIRGKKNYGFFRMTQCARGRPSHQKHTVRASTLRIWTGGGGKKKNPLVSASGLSPRKKLRPVLCTENFAITRASH